jgi:hypothetical protein
MDDIVVRVDNLEDCAKENKGKINEIEDRLDLHSDSIRSLDQWRKGNGAAGAEERLQITEAVVLGYQRLRLPERMAINEADIEVLQRIADGKISDAVKESVRSTLDARDRTAIAYLKALGPYLATIVALIAAIIAGIK